MPQLRDSKTSAVVLETETPLELVILAAELGTATVVGIDEDLDGNVDLLFDGVGLGFDPETVLKAARENADGLAGAVRTAKGEERKRLEAAAKDAKAALEPDRAKLEEARGRLERLRKG